MMIATPRAGCQAASRLRGGYGRRAEPRGGRDAGGPPRPQGVLRGWRAAVPRRAGRVGGWLPGEVAEGAPLLGGRGAPLEEADAECADVLARLEVEAVLRRARAVVAGAVAAERVVH